MTNTEIAETSGTRIERGPRIKPGVLCTITQEEGHGGIARVSVLLWNAMNELFGPASRRIVLAQRSPKPGMLDKARFSWEVAASQLRGGADWLIFDHLHIAAVQNTLPRSLRAPYAVFLHSMEAWGTLSAGRQRLLRNATVRLANSHYTAERIAQMHPDAGPIQVCHLALPRDQENAAGGTKVGALEVSDLAVLVVGRMSSGEKYKGHDQLFQAWPLVQRSVPGAQLIIVGTGDDVPRLQQLATETGHAKSIVFTGRVSDSELDALYGKAALFAMASRCEGFGLVYLEAMRRRLPCVASVNDAAREVVEDSETGFLVEQSDVPGLGSALIRLLSDAALRREMGDKGWQRWKTEFSFDRFKQRFSEAMRPVWQR